LRVDKNSLIEYNQPPVSGKTSKLAIFLFVAIALVVGFLLGQKYHNFTQYGSFDVENLDYSSLDEVYNVLKNTYDGNITQADLIGGAKKGLVAGLGDQYTEYFTADEAKTYFDDLEGSFEGIGAELGKVKEVLTINWVLDGSPAAKNDLKNGDIIARVNDENSLDWAPEYAVTKIRGEAGTTVKLTIIRGQQTLEKTITRAKINEPSVRYEIKPDNIGYLRISRFGETDTVELTRKAAKEFVDKKVSGIVLDLRNNGGGYVTAARDVASLWLDQSAVIASEKGLFTPETKLYATGSNTLSNIKTTILVNGYTASASEILAGALRDNGKATLIGTKTYGKGVVQSIKTLSDGGRLKITSAKWYTPNGTSIDHAGLEPDQPLDFDAEAYQQTATDNQLTRALELLKTQ
jgi:carboxyl-terminal processing protease